MTSNIDYVKDIRTEEETINNINKYNRQENINFIKFRELLLKFNFKLGKFVRRGQILSDINTLQQGEVNPDFKLIINNKEINLEIKHSKRDLKSFYLKQAQVDKYMNYDNIYILFIMDCFENPSFSIIKPHEIINNEISTPAFMGFKDCYKVYRRDFKWFKFDSSNGYLKKYLENRLDIK